MDAEKIVTALVLYALFVTYVAGHARGRLRR
jgi:hypothetical protein